MINAYPMEFRRDVVQGRLTPIEFETMIATPVALAA